MSELIKTILIVDNEAFTRQSFADYPEELDCHRDLSLAFKISESSSG